MKGVNKFVSEPVPSCSRVRSLSDIDGKTAMDQIQQSKWKESLLGLQLKKLVTSTIVRKGC